MLTREELLGLSRGHYITGLWYNKITEYMFRYPCWGYCGCGLDKLILHVEKRIVVKFSYDFPKELEYKPYQLPGILYPYYVTRFTDIKEELWISEYLYIDDPILPRNSFDLERQMIIDRYSYNKLSKVQGKYITKRIIPMLDKVYSKLEKEVERFVRKCKRIRERKHNIVQE